MRTGLVVDVDAETGMRNPGTHQNFRGSGKLLAGRNMADRFNDTLQGIDALVKGGGGQVDGKFVGDGPSAEARQDEDENQGKNADQGVNEKQAITNAPETAALEGAEEAEGQKDADGEKKKNAEDGETGFTGEIEEDEDERQHQEGDTGFAQAAGYLADGGRHRIRIEGLTRLSPFDEPGEIWSV